MDIHVAKKVESFFTKFRSKTYKKGEILIRADEDPSGIFYLTKGQVKEYAISRKGDELVVNVFKPISFFPMSWAINETPNKYYFEAMTPLTVYHAPRLEAVEFIKKNPDVLFDLMSRVYKGTDGMLLRMTYLMSGNAYNRLITELLIYARRFGNNKNSVDVQISETELATQSGMTRETVSREMKALKEKNLVVLRENTFVIRDVQKLEMELGEGFTP